MTMSNAAIAKELSELRAQIEELQQVQTLDQKNQQSHTDKLSEESPVPELDTDSISRVLSEKLGMGEAETQIQDFVTALEEEIKDANPMTMLVVFALGVLIGRLLPK